MAKSISSYFTAPTRTRIAGLAAALLLCTVTGAGARAQLDDEGPRPARSGGNGVLTRFNFDLGMAAGSVGARAYTEYSLGANAYISEFLNWRNALFSRLESGVDTRYGLDSSARFTIGFKKRDSGFALFGGPGARIPFSGSVSPLAEAGLFVNLSGLTIGGGVKSILNSIPRRAADDEIQFFLFLAGRDSL